MKQIICIWLTLCIFAVSTFFCGAQVATEYESADLTAPYEDDVAAVAALPVTDVPAAVLMEKETGKILFQKAAHEKRSPASITKIMSLLLVMEAIDSGKLSLDTTIVASEHAAAMGGSQIWLEKGEKMTVDELLRASVIASANDATVALAEAVAGSEEAFVNMMNRKAAALKMNDTHFENCSGLDADGHISSAHDIAVMSCELLRHERIKNYSTVWMDTLRDGKSQLVNTNKLVRFYDGATGLKTGTTSKAGFCVSATATKNGMELCAVVLGASDNNARFGAARKLLDYGFANWSIHTVEVEQEKLCTVKIVGGVESELLPKVSGTGKYLLSNDESDGITTKISLPKEMKAPIAVGQKIGTAEVLLNGKQIGSIDIIAENAVEKFTFLKAITLLFTSLITI